MNIIEPDTNYYKLGDKYSYDIKSYANDYELLTFYYLKYSNRKFIETYNNKKKLTTRKAFPIPIGLNFTYLGYVEIYFIELKKKLPKNKTIGIVKGIGPVEIVNEMLHLYTGIEKTLNGLGNKTYTIFYYYHWGTNNKYKNIKSNMNNLKYDVFHDDINLNKINNKNKIKKEVVFCNEISLLQQSHPDNEVKSIPLRLKFINASLDILQKGGDLYLQYFNCSKVETLLIMISLSECFEEYNFIRSKMRKDEIVGGYYIFKKYNGKKLNKVINVNIANTNNILQIKNNSFVKFINKTQQKIYLNYLYFLKKCEMILRSKKSKSYFENYQISLGIDWCVKNKIMILNYYKQILYKEKNEELLKKIFYPQKNINYKKLNVYYDSFYSVTFYEDYLQIAKIIKKYFPNEKKIVDACSNVGASTISLSYNFNEVVGIEIDENRFKLLKNNVDVYKRKNIELINDDFLNLQNKLKNDLIFFDPPWEGIYYKLKKKIELYLGDKNLKDVLNNKYIIKAPKNFNYKGMKNIHIEKLKHFLLIIKTK